MATGPTKAEAKTDQKSGKQDTYKGISAPVIQLPKGGGAIKAIDEKFSVNSVNGTASFALPVPVADARGFSPSLSLSYNSGGGNGVFGLGWSMGLASIKRKTEKELPRYADATDSDTYLLSQAEDLVPVLRKNGSAWTTEKKETDSEDGVYRIRFYRPRIEGGFARIERWRHKTDGSIHWRVTGKDNVTTLYGFSASARIFDPADPKKIFEWLVEFSYDDKGHAILYEYKAEDKTGLPAHELHERNRVNDLALYTNTYLKRVKYGNVQPYLHHGDPFPAQFLFENVLDYGEHDAVVPPFNETGVWTYRADAYSDYRSGFEIRTSRLCRRVLLYHRFAEYNAPVKTVTFNYDDNGQQGFRFLRSAVITGYTKHDDGSFTNKSMPPFSFEYLAHAWNTEIKSVGRDALMHAPAGIDEPRYQWIDLFGEGLSGLLTEQGGSWYYKQNLGQGNFTRAHRVDPHPSFSGLDSQVKLLDLEGDTLKELVSDQPGSKGFFALDENNQWEPFRAFETVHNVNAGDPHAKLLDLDGDGKADLLIAEDEVFTWYPSKGKKGYGPAQHVRRTTDEEKGPYIVFADGTQTIFVADMSGDGLSDLVRIRNGEVCYWPNLGLGRFGAKVSMTGAPQFDHPEHFDAGLIRLGDVDGSGTTDIIYLGRKQFRVWMNQQGNRFLPAPVVIDPFPEFNKNVQVSLLDLLGTGTSCIVWNSTSPKDADQPLRYIDLMSSRKPHVMHTYKNNMGKEVHVEYTPSTRYFIDDKLAGKPWVTRLPFPVHCVSKVVSIDRILKLRFASTYTYHHGYYDIDEREFRGFGRVEQTDAETIDHFVKESGGMMNNVVEQDLHQHPVKTVSWFHTGAWKSAGRILNQFAHEYYKNPVVPEHRLPQPELESHLSVQECREAVRACKSTMLRKEIYALDGTGEEKIPYLVEEHNAMIRLLQPVKNNKYGVFHSHESESISYHYERNPADARVGHTFVLEIDEQWGLVKRSASVGYPRRPPAMGMPPHPPEQTQLLVAYTEQSYTNPVVESGAFRAPGPHLKKTFELVGLVPEPSGYFDRHKLGQSCENASFADYHETAAPGKKRLVSLSRIQYRDDDTSTPLAFGALDSKSLLHETYEAALNRPMLNLFSAHLAPVALETLLTDAAKGGYVFADNYFWIPSGTASYDKDHFYQSTEFTDPFNKKTLIKYDSSYHLFVEQSQDAFLNTTRVLKFNWRTLHGMLVEDINGNRSAIRFDELARVNKTFLAGKPGTDAGDVFDATSLEASSNDQPTTTLEYVTDEWYNQSTALGFNPDTSYKPRPNYVFTRSRETHYHADPMHVTKWQETYSYSDGNGHELLKKTLSEAGPALKVEADGTVTSVPSADPRWVGDGRVILNNKGNKVKAYEPYFSVNSAFDDEKEMVELGNVAVSVFDPLDRIIRVDKPNGTFTSVVFTPWIEFEYDENDNVRHAACKWYADRGSPNPAGAEPSDREERAAWLAAHHFDTPQEKHFDSMGRSFLTVANNGPDGNYEHHIELDIQGNEKAVRDALNRPVEQYRNNIQGHKIGHKSIDSGERWLLNDVLGKPLVSWDERGHMYTHEYDDAHRPLAVYVTEGGITKMVNRISYGETAPPAADPVGNKLKGRIYKRYDQSGVVTNTSYDFKGNLLIQSRQFTEKYDTIIDWSTLAGVPLLPEIFESNTRYDALNRPVRIETPHTAGMLSSIIVPAYNAAGLPETVDVDLRAGGVIRVVENINYNAKGQRTEVFFGNGTKTKYTYDTFSHLLKGVLTTKNAGSVKLLDIHYTYDPAGNITTMRDDAQSVLHFSGEMTEPVMQYAYDAVYQLVGAEGRKHAGQNVVQHHRSDHQYGNHPFIPNPAPPPSPNDTAAFCNYHEQYKYDVVGNMTEQKHTSVFNGFTRTFEYAFNTAANNRLTKTEVGAFSFLYDGYDAHGNMTKMEHLPGMSWNYKDELSMLDLGPGGGKAWYTYDFEGRRVRKVIERPDGTRKERLYIGEFEMYREYDAASVIQLERESLSIQSGNQRIALVETKTIDKGAVLALPEPLWRYQYENNLGAATLELDDHALLISYEEYFPFGTTSFSTVDSMREVPEKRYRYTAKERDGESGLNYHGARYYAPWLCRWTAPDPAGIKDGLNSYIYVNNRPVILHDPNGKDGFLRNAGNFFVGLGESVVETGAGIATAVRHPIDTVNNIGTTMSNTYSEFGGGATGVFMAANQLNPAFHMFVAGDRAVTAVQNGNYREAGRQTGHTVINAASLAAIPFSGGASGGVSVGTRAASLVVRAESIAVRGTALVRVPAVAIPVVVPVVTVTAQAGVRIGAGVVAGTQVMAMASNGGPPGPRGGSGRGSGRGSGNGGNRGGGRNRNQNRPRPEEDIAEGGGNGNRGNNRRGGDEPPSGRGRDNPRRQGRQHDPAMFAPMLDAEGLAAELSTGRRTLMNDLGVQSSSELTVGEIWEGTAATAEHFDATLGPWQQQHRMFANVTRTSDGASFQISINRNRLTGNVGDIHLSSHQLR